MAGFREYNLLDLIDHLQFHVEPGRESEYLRSLPRGVRRTVLKTYAEIVNSRLPLTRDSTSVDWVVADAEHPAE